MALIIFFPFVRFGSGSGPIHLKEVLCHGNESHILRCRYRGLDETVTGCQHDQDVAVACCEFVSVCVCVLRDSKHFTLSECAQLCIMLNNICSE